MQTGGARVRDAIVMWRSTKLAVLVALCAAFYAALLIPFKPIPLIPGFMDISLKS